jgi:CheY-like chemotaxis protein
MRKVIEMTFAGEDIRVVTVASAQDALSTCRREPPDVVVTDVALEGASGYDLCRQIKDEFGRIPVVLLSSKQNPFDPARGQASGADDHIDKPYDTAKAIELVKKVLQKGISVAPAPIAAAPIAQAPAAPRAPMFSPPLPVVTPAAPPVGPAQVPAQLGHATVPGMSAQRPALQRNNSPALARNVTVKMPSEPPPPAMERPALTRQATPALRPQSTVKMTSDAPPASTQTQVQIHATAPTNTSTNGAAPLPPELAGKLKSIGLTPAQVDAVLALSREVVEQVVWEVVPVLAETLIREEIARLTKE